MSKKWIVLEFLFLLCGMGNLLAQSNNSTLFVENLGQYPTTVKFYSEIPGGVMFIGEDGLTYSFQQTPTSHHNHLTSEVRKDAETKVEHYALKIRFIESSASPKITGLELAETKYSYFLGDDPARWVSGARTFKTVLIEDLYEGIDFQISTSEGRLKYDLILDPGINPACVQMKYDGVTSLDLIDNRLVIDIPNGELTEYIPESYAICNDERRKIESKYVVDSDVVSFELDDVDVEERVIIDPLLVFSTYSGSQSNNWGNTATFDEQGNAYAGGITTTLNNPDGTVGEFPATSGAYQTENAGNWDVAILKFDSTGSNLLYATHLGGTNSDIPQSLIVDKNGDLLILGITASNSFPVTDLAYDTTFNGGIFYELLSGIDMDSGSDLFISKLSNDGSELLASTFIGGQYNDGMLPSANELSRNYGDESRGDINFDSNGDIIITSRTASPDFPTLNAYDTTFNGNTDAIVLKLSEDLDSLKWSTFLGGVDSDVALSVKIDTEDNIFVAGGTSSLNFPVTENAYHKTFGGVVDGWVAHLSGEGDSLLASTFVGTEFYDQTFFLDLDGNQDVYVAGQTQADYHVTFGKYSHGRGGQFIQKLSNNLEASIFSTVLGTSSTLNPNISLTAFLVNDCNNIYLSGWGSPLIRSDNDFSLNTTGLPITSDAYQLTTDGSSFYLAVLSGDASELLYATHLGTSESYVHVDGGTSRFDKHGIVYHAVCASCEGDSSFPTTPGAYSEVNESSSCNNAVFKFDLASLRARIGTNNLDLTNPGLKGGCLPLPVVFENFSTAGEVYEWDFGDGNKRTVYTQDTIIHYYENPGKFNVELRAFDPNTCIAEDYAYTSITVAEPDFSVSENSNICFGTSIQLHASGGTSYLWSPRDGLDNFLSASPIASPKDTTLYIVEILNSNGCNLVDSVKINVIPEIIPDLRLEAYNICEGSREIKLINESDNAESITWSLGDGTEITDWEVNHEYAEDGRYRVVGTLQSNKCSESVEFDLRILELNIPNVLTRNNDGINDVLKITSAQPVGLTIFTRWGTEVYKSTSYKNDWGGKDLTSGIYFYEAILFNGEVCSGWIQLLNDN